MYEVEIPDRIARLRESNANREWQDLCTLLERIAEELRSQADGSTLQAELQTKGADLLVQLDQRLRRLEEQAEE